MPSNVLLVFGDAKNESIRHVIRTERLAFLTFLSISPAIRSKMITTSSDTFSACLSALRKMQYDLRDAE